MELSTLLLVAGTAVSAVGQLASASAAKNASNFNAQVASNNAIAARQTAAANAARESRLSRKRLGALRANIGASGITLAGTPLDLLEDSAAEEELNRLSIIQGGETQARGFENTASLDRAAASNAQTAGFFGAGSELLLGGSKLFPV